MMACPWTLLMGWIPFGQCWQHGRNIKFAAFRYDFIARNSATRMHARKFGENAILVDGDEMRCDWWAKFR